MRRVVRRIVIFLLGVLVGGGLMAAVPPGKAHDDLTGALAAPENHPLLVHMTTADSWRGAMGLEFAHAMMKIGHPVAVFLNLDAVKLAQARSREPVEKSGSQNCLERVAGHERKSEHARPRSSDGLKFFDALPNRNLQVLDRFSHRAIITTAPTIWVHR